MTIILKSLLKTVIVAAVIAGTAMLFEYPFIKTFIVASIGQFIIFYIWNSVMSMILKNKFEAEETSRVTEWTKQGVDVQCAYCGAINFIPIRLDDDNEFECTECGKTNSVYVNITTAQQTDTLDREKLSVSSYISDKIKTVQEIKDKKDNDTE